MESHSNHTHSDHYHDLNQHDSTDLSHKHFSHHHLSHDHLTDVDRVHGDYCGIHGNSGHDHEYKHDLKANTVTHDYTHERLSKLGSYATRDIPKKRSYEMRSFCVGIGGPVGSGKTALMLQLCLNLKSNFNLCAVTNDIFTKEDGEFLLRNQALDSDRIVAVETGGCPHAAIREDITANLIACEDLTVKHHCDIILLESGGDNLAADFSRELADFTIYVIDTAGGDKIPRKGGPGITQSDLLVINKTDLCEAVGASLEVMDRDAKLMRKDGPYLFAQVKHGKGVDKIVRHIEQAYYAMTK